MKFTVARDNLLEALTLVKPAVGNSKSFWASHMVRLEAANKRLTITATNLSDTAETAVGCKVRKKGVYCVPFSTLYELVKLTPEESLLEMELDKTATNLLVEAPRSKASIKGMPADEFPSKVAWPESHSLQGNAEPISRAIQRVIHAAAKDDTRPTLSGVHCTAQGATLTLTATDGFRLARSRVQLVKSVDEPITVIVSTDVLKAVSRLLDKYEGAALLAEVNEGLIFFEAAGVRMASHLIQGQYPDVERILPSATKTQILLRDEALLPALYTSQVFAEKGARLEVTRLEEGEQDIVIGLSAHGSDTGENMNRIGGKLVKGEPQTFAVNLKYMIQALTAAEDGLVMLGINSPMEPIVLYPANEVWPYTGNLAVIMPMAMPQPQPQPVQQVTAVAGEADDATGTDEVEETVVEAADEAQEVEVVEETAVAVPA